MPFSQFLDLIYQPLFAVVEVLTGITVLTTQTDAADTVKITQDVRGDPASQGISEGEALKKGSEEKAVGFKRTGAHIY